MGPRMFALPRSPAVPPQRPIWFLLRSKVLSWLYCHIAPKTAQIRMATALHKGASLSFVRFLWAKPLHVLAVSAASCLLFLTIANWIIPAHGAFAQSPSPTPTPTVSPTPDFAPTPSATPTATPKGPTLIHPSPTPSPTPSATPTPTPTPLSPGLNITPTPTPAFR